MTTTRERIIVDKAHQLDYATLSDIARRCGGWMRESGGPEGEKAEAWVDDKAYIFSGPGLVGFLYAVKEDHVQTLYEVKDLLDYIEKSGKQPASVFVRDAIIARAREVKAKMKGSGAS